jgi:hypothetical protein
MRPLFLCSVSAIVRLCKQGFDVQTATSLQSSDLIRIETTALPVRRNSIYARIRDT